MAEEAELLVTRRPRRSTAGNRMEAALAEFKAEELGQDQEEDVDFVIEKDEEDAFESDFESTDEDGAQEDVDAVAEKIVQEEEKRIRKTGRTQLDRITAAAHARHAATFNPQLHDDDFSSSTSTPKHKHRVSRRVSMGIVVDAATGEVLEGSVPGTDGKRYSRRTHTMLNTRDTVSRIKDAVEKKSTVPKKSKTKARPPTQAELIQRALDMEEGNVIEHREYLSVEEEKRKRARLVKQRIEGPLLRWVSKAVEEKVTIEQPPSASVPAQTTIPTPAVTITPTYQPPPPPPPLQQPQTVLPYGYTFPGTATSTPVIQPQSQPQPQPQPPSLPQQKQASGSSNSKPKFFHPSSLLSSSSASPSTSLASPSPSAYTYAPPSSYGYYVPPASPYAVPGQTPPSQNTGAVGPLTSTTYSYTPPAPPPATSAQTHMLPPPTPALPTSPSTTQITPYVTMNTQYTFYPPPPPPVVPPPSPVIVETRKVARSYLIHELSQDSDSDSEKDKDKEKDRDKEWEKEKERERRKRVSSGNHPKPTWGETMRALFGDHVNWEEVRVFVGKNRPLSRPIQICPLTGQPAPYRDPRSGLPFASQFAYQTLTKILDHEFVYSSNLGCYTAFSGPPIVAGGSGGQAGGGGAAGGGEDTDGGTSSEVVAGKKRARGAG
ncbi:hypothetical protein K474DRAFT_725781 [Panus rudis PR-1116 ss-1]|nr:hypothetical protein K474DRAFT_725781 [Panus rudis PR-1116 ss-1]